MAFKIGQIQHPDFQLSLTEWTKWRTAYEGGDTFKSDYLKKLSSRETDDDFESRKALTYPPTHAKAAVNDIKNAIFQRTCDVARRGGDPTFQDAVKGDRNGVDLRQSTMCSYIGREVLPELLVLGKVGVYVDMPQQVGQTKSDSQGLHPYVYTYTAEHIRAWEYDDQGEVNEFKQVLLIDHVFSKDSELGLPSKKVERFRYVWKDEDDGLIHVQFYNIDGKKIQKDGTEDVNSEIILQIKKIPFVIFEIPHSLMADIADYQIALLNLESSDIGYAMQSNYPFYTEQFDHRTDGSFYQTGNDNGEGEATEQIAQTRDANTGGNQGRRYPKGTERPAFINPSPDTLRVSMEKGDKIKADIRRLVNLAVKDFSPAMQSAESKSADESSLESGLSFIGLVLETGENKIAEYWAIYVNGASAKVTYPKSYKIRTDKDRWEEVEILQKRMHQLPSNTYRQVLAKRMASILLEERVSDTELAKIHKEIMEADTMTSDPNILLPAVEAGLCDNELASKALGFPEGTVEKAKKEHMERIKQINESQGGEGGQARGVDDLQVDQGSSKEEKTGKPRRGEGK